MKLRTRSARFPAGGLRRFSSRQFQLTGSSTSRRTDWRLESLLTRPLESGRYSGCPNTLLHFQSPGRAHRPASTGL
jgi:hypothetical protein